MNNRRVNCKIEGIMFVILKIFRGEKKKYILPFAI